MKLSKKLTAVMLSAFCLAAAIPSVPALADSQKVVTLGADLTEDQRTMILQYFGVYGEENIITLTITNEDEREHLGSYIPLEQIGTRTYSCALVNPTTSGGIQVKTANLTYVTSNMIASTLSTAGVVNCEVLAASPFAVSGTGALTGVLMAYETASGETLDEEKKETATQELVTTTTISDSIGQVEATQIVNETKIQVIEGDVLSTGEIEVIVDTVAEEEESTLSDEDRALLVELLEKIAEQDYNYEEMSETLERVEENLNQLLEEETEEDDSGDGDIESTSTDAESSEAETTGASTSDESADGSDETESSLSEDSILLNTDDSALGSDVIFDATDSAALESTEATIQESETEEETESITILDTEAETDDLNDDSETQTETSENSYGFDITVSDSYGDGDTTSDTGTETGASDSTADTEGDADSSEDLTESEPISTDDTSEAQAQTEAETEGLQTEAETSSDEVVELISLSELVFEPNTDEGAAENAKIEAALNCLTISSARTDLVAGSGTISVYNAEDGSLIETVEMSDETKVVSEEITDTDRLAELGEDWTEGIEFRIYLENPLEPNMSYYVMIDGEILTTEDGTASVQPLIDSYMIPWCFDTLGYGIGLDETVDGIITGETVTGTLYMDAETSGYAVIDSVQINDVETLASESLLAFTESSTFEMSFGEAGEAVIHVTYYDSVENMNVVNETSYTVTVQAAE
ncbi:MAG: DUF1002 domain-containing protein [Lachnospiraceae bacterium]|nr:DUF1002 domain-containing protein [Lachnospiraceae bacterium]